MCIRDRPQPVDGAQEKGDSPAQLASMLDRAKLGPGGGPASPTSPTAGNQCGNGSSEDGSAHN
eukprot:3848547-Rhodomonas_salina.1